MRTLILMLVLVPAGCRTETKVIGALGDSGADIAATGDLLPAEAAVDAASDVGPCAKMGYLCTAPGDCCPNLQCVALDAGISICTQACSPDDPATCDPFFLDALFVCGDIDPPSGRHACLRRCTPQVGWAPCPAGLACQPDSVRHTAPGLPACMLKPCSSGEDCPVRLHQVCDPKATTDQCTELEIPPGAFCAADVDSPASGHCALPGECDPVSGLCLPHSHGKATAQIGDPCQDDRDCGPAMQCDMESVGPAGVHARNGYCTIVGCDSAPALHACPPGSSCFPDLPGGRCFKDCVQEDASDCRGYHLDKHGDYDCYGGPPLKGMTICAPTDLFPCVCVDPLGGNNCQEYCGTLSNWYSCCGWQPAPPGPLDPIQMRCRNRGTGEALAEGTPGGSCMDTTASGCLESGGCAGGKLCQNGVCACPPVLTDCYGVCKDLQTDPNNCGACNTLCGPGTCESGTCSCASSKPDLCPPHGCTDMKTDYWNCGSCGSSCSTAQSCVNGQCT
jgi:hypothetical protein